MDEWIIERPLRLVALCLIGALGLEAKHHKRKKIYSKVCCTAAAANCDTC